MLADRIDDIQLALRHNELDGWFFCCFQHNDPVSLELLGLADGMVSRRCYYFIPASGSPRKLAHKLEASKLDNLPGDTSYYLTWQELSGALETLVAGSSKIAAQYSPENGLPAVSRLDAGSAEFLRNRGVELVSSADLVQQFAAVWTPEQMTGHRETCSHLHEIAHAAFAKVADILKQGEEADEYEIQKFILESFENRGLWSESDPIVAVGPHSADAHYQPSSTQSAAIRKGDFLLIDLWAKSKSTAAVYADICWCGVCDSAPTERQAEIFALAVQARDAASDLVSSRFPAAEVRGFEVDDAARNVIVEAGLGEFFIHRTGHSIGISDHGQGANMDNLETHDTRLLLPRTGFSIEPGIYFEGDFGVRTEINMVLTDTAAEITGGEPQKELLRLLC